MDNHKGKIEINNHKHLLKDTGVICTANPGRLRLGIRLRVGATSQLLLFDRSHPSHFYQPCWKGLALITWSSTVNPRMCAAFYSVERVGGGGRRTPQPFGP